MRIDTFPSSRVHVLLSISRGDEFFEPPGGSKAHSRASSFDFGIVLDHVTRSPSISGSSNLSFSDSSLFLPRILNVLIFCTRFCQCMYFARGFLKSHLKRSRMGQDMASRARTVLPAHGCKKSLGVTFCGFQGVFGCVLRRLLVAWLEASVAGSQAWQRKRG